MATEEKQAAAAEKKALEQAAKEAAKQAKADEAAAKKIAAEKAKAEKAAQIAAKKEAAARARAEKEAAREAARMPIQNGIRRPKPDGKCGAAWRVFDEVSAAKGSPTSIGEALVRTRAEGQNDSNVRTEYARWRKFYGLEGRIDDPTVAEKKEAERQAREDEKARKKAELEAKAQAAADAKRAKKEAAARAKAEKEAA